MPRPLTSWLEARLLVLGYLVALEASEPVKPSSPNGFNFLWSREAVTVTCLDLPYGGLIYEVQYKSSFDSDWESVKEETCRLTIENLDGDKCYGLRGRIRTKESSYGSDTYPSDWTEVTYWQGGQRTDECPVDEAHFPKVMLISALVVVLTVILLLLSLCKIHRVKKFLMPSVPDPKFTFSGLFEDHRGNFQEWIKDTQNVAEVCKLDNGEEECALEDTLVAQLVKMESQAAPEGKPCPETQLEGDEGTHKSPHQTPQHGDVVALGGFTFVVNENAYVML
ncbi:cytokine receptor-like factor 2 [Rhynchocyon petersi]